MTDTSASETQRIQHLSFAASNALTEARARLERINAEARARSEHINAEARANLERRKALADARKTIEHLTAQVAEIDLIESESELKEAKIADLEDQISELSEAGKEKDAKIVSLFEEIRAMAAARAELTSHLHKQAGRIAELERNALGGDSEHLIRALRAN
jgi:chromosome segregation ATPase